MLKKRAANWKCGYCALVEEGGHSSELRFPLKGHIAATTAILYSWRVVKMEEAIVLTRKTDIIHEKGHSGHNRTHIHQPNMKLQVP